MVAIGGSIPFVSPRAPIHHRTSNQRSPVWIYIHSQYVCVMYMYVYIFVYIVYIVCVYLYMYTHTLIYVYVCVYIHIYTCVCIYVYIHIYLGSVARSGYGSTDGYSDRAHPLTRTHTITCSSHRSVPLAHRIYTYTSSASTRANSPVQSGVSSTNTNGVGPIHWGTKPRAINLFARQPATRHCVCPHVNHYVRPRNVESAPLRAACSVFAANS